MSQKRKLEEFHDPDYPQNNANKKQHTGSLSSEERTARIKEIINREFNREVQIREQQLEEIDVRLSKAKEILHQIRYSVVSEYYSKQQLQYNEAEEAVSRGRSLFDNEPDGPQMPLHPAIKKIIGKKPKTYDELLRVRPTVREAAKTAKTTIKEKSRTKKEENRIQRLIKTRGIVIDHSKTDQVGSCSSTITSGMLDVKDPSGPIKIPRHIEPNMEDKPVPKLNSARLNNQTKHLIVVGNTSKYIGDEKPSDNSSHKWLIYVQTKSGIPIEKFVTKVRFFLHPSYRPNDVVDVESPPFQLARRGWGEFPVRLQLFFDARIQQKPVQLVHNLVLDKTLSGLQTMGAETLVEIWLRTDSIVPPVSPPAEPSQRPSRLSETITKSSGLLSPTKTAEIMNPKAEIDDNLFDFLDKIDQPAICADIEKIQPTFMDSPMVDTHIPKKPLGLPPVRTITESIMRLSEDSQRIEPQHIETQQNVSQTPLQTDLPPPPEPPVPTAAPSAIRKSQTDREIVQRLTPVVSQENCHIQQPIRMESTQSSVKTETPTSAVTNAFQPANGSTNQLLTNPKLLQKKLVQLIDKEGNIRYLQMLVAAKGTIPMQTIQQKQQTTDIVQANGLRKSFSVNGDTSKPIQVVNKIEARPKAIDTNGNIPGTSQEKEFKSENALPPSVSSSSAAKPEPLGLKQQSLLRHNGPPKNQVIHKEGKVYIIDPLQTKLKQEQKKQVSLLKPQISLLKPIAQNDNLGNCIRNNASNVFNHTSIATDHDYTSRLNPNRPPANTVTIIKSSAQIRPSFTRPNTITVRNFPNPANFIPSKVPELKKGNFIPVKVNHKPVIALMKKQRREYRRELEQQFQGTPFASVRNAVEFLLRRLPMVNSLASESDYRMSFPFIVANWTEFRKTIPIKLKALEWLRAKYISRNINQYPVFKPEDHWTTKEIVLFARHHAYTPVIGSMKEHQQLINRTATNETKLKLEPDTSLTDLVKNEIEKEQIRYQTITPNHRICDWAEESWKRVNTHHNANEMIIDVESTDEAELQSKCSIKDSPFKNYQGKLWMSIDEKLEKEASLVNGMCQEIGIRLQPEEIHRDVIHPTAQTIMAHTLHLFIQDMVRQSVAFKMKNNNKSSTTSSLSLEPNDIRSAINSRPEFDFLTNKYFGTIKSKDLLELG